METAFLKHANTIRKGGKKWTFHKTQNFANYFIFLKI